MWSPGSVERLGVRLGSLVGAAFGLVFVLVNAGGIAGSALWQVAAVVAFAAVVAAAARSRVSAPPPAPTALRTYGACVLAEVVAIPVGARVLTALDQPDLVLCWVVLVVGVHFGPFARAFDAPVFLPLAIALVLLALGGGALVLAGVDDAQLATGVVAGFVLLAVAGRAVSGRDGSAAPA